MNGNTITLTANDLFAEIISLERAIVKLKEKFLAVMPAPYGNDVWWEKSVKDGVESLKAGEGKKFDNYKDAVAYLNS